MYNNSKYSSNYGRTNSLHVGLLNTYYEDSVLHFKGLMILILPTNIHNILITETRWITLNTLGTTNNNVTITNKNGQTTCVVNIEKQNNYDIEITNKNKCLYKTRYILKEKMYISAKGGYGQKAKSYSYTRAILSLFYFIFSFC